MTIRWIQDGEPHDAEVFNRPLRDFVSTEIQSLVPNTRTISSTNGITGGGALSTDITLNGINATATQIGVARFATRGELANGGVGGLIANPADIVEMGGGLGMGGQKWHDVTALRTKSTIYVNTTQSPIMISVVCSGDRGNPASRLLVDGLWVAVLAEDSGATTVDCQMTAIVPVGKTYQLITNGSPQLWAELRNGRA